MATDCQKERNTTLLTHSSLPTWDREITMHGSVPEARAKRVAGTSPYRLPMSQVVLADFVEEDQTVHGPDLTEVVLRAYSSQQMCTYQHVGIANQGSKMDRRLTMVAM